MRGVPYALCWLFSLQVERVVAERAGESRSMLVKWEGLPYCEATWEAADDVMAAPGGPQARDDFLTRQQRLQVCILGTQGASHVPAAPADLYHGGGGFLTEALWHRPAAPAGVSWGRGPCSQVCFMVLLVLVPLCCVYRDPCLPQSKHSCWFQVTPCSHVPVRIVHTHTHTHTAPTCSLAGCSEPCKPLLRMWSCGHVVMQETARGVDAARSASVKGAGGSSLELQQQPPFLTAGKLRDYQLEGLNWLTYAWLKVC